LTVEPVEPLLGTDPEGRKILENRVRATLFNKLDSIRSLFGLTSWPVVLSAEAANQVLNGDLEYETPGFARRESLFGMWHWLNEGAHEREWAGSDLRLEMPVAWESLVLQELGLALPEGRSAIAAMAVMVDENCATHMVPVHSVQAWNGLSVLNTGSFNGMMQSPWVMRTGRLASWVADVSSKQFRWCLESLEESESANTISVEDDGDEVVAVETSAASCFAPYVADDTAPQLVAPSSAMSGPGAHVEAVLLAILRQLHASPEVGPKLQLVPRSMIWQEYSRLKTKGGALAPRDLIRPLEVHRPTSTQNHGWRASNLWILVENP
jgi:hypothetical protein